MLNRHLLTNSSALAAGVLALALTASAAGQTATPDVVVELPNFVVSATRTPQDAQFTTSSVDVLPLLRLDLAQVGDLRTALGTIPGVNIVNTGATGGQSSVFIRGAASTQTLFVVDGIPMNSRSAQYNNFLGSADLVGLDRVEVLRGPQSTLYGSAAMGGVIFIDSARGCGPATGSVATTFGSFDTFGASAAVKGGTTSLGYSASLGRFHTDNAQPHNGFDSWSYSTRVEGSPTASLLVGATFRGQQGDYQETGGRWGSAYDVAADNHLTTLYAQWSQAKDFASRLTAGQQQRRYTSVGAYGTTELRDRRDIVDWQNTWFDFQGVEVVAGAALERAHHGNDGVNTSADNAAGYLSTTIHPSKNSTVSAGLRYDDFDTFGSAWTWRTSASWLPIAGTKVHASIGSGFCAPSTEDLYGLPGSGYWEASPGLKAEKSTGWDVGLDQKLCGDALAASVTYFRTRYRDRINWVDLGNWTGRQGNIDRSVSDGVETAVTMAFTKSLRSRLAYTYLEVENTATHTRLQRQPRHTIDAEVTAQPLASWTVGAGLRVVADRIDKTPEDNTLHRIEDYSAVRLFTSYEVAKNLVLKARIENALNERYDEVGGYAALPFRTFGGIEWKF